MTKLYDGQVADLLQNPGKHNPEIQALSFAVLQEKRRIMAEAQMTRTMAMVDTVPEIILDVLAVELRTPAYDETFPVETKRQLIKGTMAFYARLGTPWAVNWVIRTIFGNGHISEWFSYGGKPHHFRVSAQNDGTFETLDGLAAFLRMISTVKRLTSWIDGIDVDTDMGEQTIRIGGAMCIQTRMPLPEITQITMFGARLRMGGSVAATPRIAVPQIQDEISLTSKTKLGIQMTVTTTIPLPEIP